MEKRNLLFVSLILALSIPLLIMAPFNDNKDQVSSTKRKPSSSSNSAKIAKSRKKIKLRSYRKINSELGQIPKSILPLFNLKSYQDRLRFVFKLPTDLNAIERDALYMLLRNDENGSKDLHVKDEIMCRLEKQTTRPEEYERALYSIMKDDRIDGDLRGYAVQHLRSAYAIEGTDKSLIKEALFQALEDDQSDVSGTAMLAFAQADAKESLVADQAEEEFVKARALELAADESIHTPSRNTIIECCGRMGCKEIIPIAKEVIADDPRSGRMSTIADKLPAIASIGHVGDESNIVMLEELSKNRRLKPAASAAITRIKKRLNLD